MFLRVKYSLKLVILQVLDPVYRRISRRSFRYYKQFFSPTGFIPFQKDYFCFNKRTTLPTWKAQDFILTFSKSPNKINHMSLTVSGVTSAGTLLNDKYDCNYAITDPLRLHNDKYDYAQNISTFLLSNFYWIVPKPTFL